MLRNRTGFTLVELLVVISIIMVLAGLLLPVLGRAREEARRSSCANNLGQIGKAQMAYMERSGDYWTYQYDGRDNTASGVVNGHPHRSQPFFNASVSLSLLYPGAVDAQEIFRCPSSGDRPRIARGVSNGHVYAWFGRLDGKEHKTGGALSVINPRENDANLGTSYGYDDLAGRRDMLPATARAADMRWIGPNDKEWSNHGDDGQNVLYWDGHVAFADNVYASADTQDNIYASSATDAAELRDNCDADTVLIRTHADAY